MYVGALEFDVLLGDVSSLKGKRSVVRPVLAELRRKFDVAVAEAGHLDLHRRALLGVSCLAADRGHVVQLLDRCERLVANRPELEMLSARRRIFGPHDEDE
ncbi:MAG TPA: DUF503 domain-containing protein [Pseudonocardia sp.]|jgi:hypothetical protein